MAKSDLHDQIAATAEQLETLEDDLHERDGLDEVRERVSTIRRELVDEALGDMLEDLAE